MFEIQMLKIIFRTKRDQITVYWRKFPSEEFNDIVTWKPEAPNLRQ